MTAVYVGGHNMQRRLIPNLIDRDSIQLGTGEGNLAFITFWNGCFTIELLMEEE